MFFYTNQYFICLHKCTKHMLILLLHLVLIKDRGLGMARKKCEGLNRVTLSDNESYYAYENLQKLPLPSQYKNLFKIWRISNFFYDTC